MPSFVFLYRYNLQTKKTMPSGNMQEQIQRFQEWMAGCLKKGAILPGGSALDIDGRVVKSKHLISDGPFVESKEIVGGFTLVKARNLNAASKLAATCPCLGPSFKIEVRPLKKGR